MKFLELPLPTGELILVNPHSIAKVEQTSSIHCVLHFIGNYPAPLTIINNLREVEEMISKALNAH